MKFWLKQVLVAFDQFCNAVLGGWADETWSARCWREQKKRWITFLNLFETDHCKLSFDSERLRLQSPPEER